MLNCDLVFHDCALSFSEAKASVLKQNTFSIKLVESYPEGSAQITFSFYNSKGQPMILLSIFNFHRNQPPTVILTIYVLTQFPPSTPFKQPPNKPPMPKTNDTNKRRSVNFLTAPSNQPAPTTNSTTVAI